MTRCRAVSVIGPVWQVDHGDAWVKNVDPCVCLCVCVMGFLNSHLAVKYKASFNKRDADESVFEPCPTCCTAGKKFFCTLTEFVFSSTNLNDSNFTSYYFKWLFYLNKEKMYTNIAPSVKLIAKNCHQVFSLKMGMNLSILSGEISKRFFF